MIYICSYIVMIPTWIFPGVQPDVRCLRLTRIPVSVTCYLHTIRTYISIQYTQYIHIYFRYIQYIHVTCKNMKLFEVISLSKLSALSFRKNIGFPFGTMTRRCFPRIVTVVTTAVVVSAKKVEHLGWKLFWGKKKWSAKFFQNFPQKLSEFQ